MRTLSFLSLVLLPGCLAPVDLIGGSDPSPPAGMRQPLSLSFAPAVSLPAGRTDRAFMVAADLNGDGHEDIAIASYEGIAVGIHLGRGDGTFQNRTVVPLGYHPVGLAVGHFSGTAALELATISHFTNLMSILGNTPASGTFLEKRRHNVNELDQVSAFASGDLDGDGRSDLAAVADDGILGDNIKGNRLSVLLNDESVSFAIKPGGKELNMITGMVAGDFTGDGTTELAVLESSSGQVEMWAYRGSSAMMSRVATIPLPAETSSARGIFSGDFDGDGRLDFATLGESHLNIFPNRGEFWRPSIPYAAGAFPHAVAPADFNLDGIPDLAVANRGTNAASAGVDRDSSDSTVGILLGNREGSFAPVQLFDPGRGESSKYKMVFRNRPTSLVVRDFNEDGLPDIATVNYTTDAISILLNTSGDILR